MLKGMENWGAGGGRRGRPPKPTTNPLGEFLRREREGRGWTIRQLAKEIGMDDSSAGYLSQLETGSKVPSAEVAERLEERLGDGRGIFRLWSLTGRRTSREQAGSAFRELARLLGDESLLNDPFIHPRPWRAHLSGPPVVPAPPGDWQELPASKIAEEAGPDFSIATSGSVTDEVTPLPDADPAEEGVPSRAERVETRYAWMRRASAHAVRAPLLPEGTLPDDYPGRAMLQRESITLEPDALPGPPLVRPFAYRLSAEGVRRVRHVLREGDVAVMTREAMPIVRQEIYGVRMGQRVVLSYVVWNGRELLLLPAPEDSDFEVVHADPNALTALVVARVVTAVRDLEGPRRRGMDT